jgi:hypothetical protein
MYTPPVIAFQTSISCGKLSLHSKKALNHIDILGNSKWRFLCIKGTGTEKRGLHHSDERAPVGRGKVVLLVCQFATLAEADGTDF